MKKITMFMMASCPYCRRALEYEKQLLEEHPEYAAVEKEMIDERLEPKLAEKYDYYYVPTYYVDGVKLHEGAAEKADVKAVFDAALS